MRGIRRAGVAICAGFVAIGGGPAVAGPPPYMVVVNGISTKTDWRLEGDSAGGVSLQAGSSPTMGCSTAHVNGQVHGGNTSFSGPIASISSSSWSGCTGPAAIPMTVTYIGTWHFHGTGGETAAISDVVTGYVAGIKTRWSSVTPGVCSFDLMGDAYAELHESVYRMPGWWGQDLVIDESGGNLTVSNISGCLGVLAPNDPADFAVTFQLKTFNAANNVIPGTPINVT